MEITYELQSISIISVLKIFVLITIAGGLILGILTAVFREENRKLDLRARVLSAAIFIFLWTSTVLGAVIFIVLLYNVISIWLGGVIIHIKQL